MNLFSLLGRRRQTRLALAPAVPIPVPMEDWEQELWTTVHKASADAAPHLPWGVRHGAEALDDIGMDDGA